MTASQKVEMALSYAGINKSELARRLNTTPQNLRLKFMRNSFRPDDLEEIAQAIGAGFDYKFEFPDGTII